MLNGVQWIMAFIIFIVKTEANLLESIIHILYEFQGDFKTE